MIFMLIILYFRKIAHKHFIIIIITLMIEAVGRNVNLIILLSGIKYSTLVELILLIIGIDVGYDANAMINKLHTSWELIGLYYITYILYRITQYLNDEQPQENDNTSYFMRFFEFLSKVINKLLLWIIYFVLLILFSCQSPTLFVNGYVLILIILISVHIIANIGNSKYEGYIKTIPWWAILRFYNVALFCSLYLFNFLLHTVKVNYKPDLTKFNYMVFAGFDFSTLTNWKLQKDFLVQFIVLYCGYLARLHIISRLSQPANPESDTIKYSRWIWILGIKILDIISEYSFHVLFLIVMSLGIFWSVNLMMLLYLIFFSLHYCMLHARYFGCFTKIKAPIKHFDAREVIILEEKEKQKACSIAQRRSSLFFLVIFTGTTLFISSVFRFSHSISSFYDKYSSFDENRRPILDTIKSIQALGTYLGTVTSYKKIYSYTMIGYIGIVFLCWIEGLCTEWCYNRCGFSFKLIENVDKPKEVKVEEEKKLDEIETEEIRAKKEANEKAIKEKWIKYKILIMTSAKIVFEHLIIASFLFTAVLKNNVLELAYIPVSLLCLIYGISFGMSLTFSYYSFFLLIVQYFLCLANITHDSAPQDVENTYFLKAFHLQHWPLYKIVMANWRLREDWATYIGVGNTPTTRILFMYDVFTLFAQFIYFQLFCHPFYCLTKAKNKEKGSSIFSIKSESIGDEESGAVRFLKGLYDIIKKVFFAYSHILTLFALITLNTMSQGLIAFVYLLFSITFMQFDLFSEIGTKKWNLPLYLRYLLKPYVFADLLTQFILQIPSFEIEKLEGLRYIGIQDIDVNPYAILLKILIFVIIIYQYYSICNSEKMRLRKFV